MRVVGSTINVISLYVHWTSVKCTHFALDYDYIVREYVWDVCGYIAMFLSYPLYSGPCLYRNVTFVYMLSGATSCHFLHIYLEFFIPSCNTLRPFHFPHLASTSRYVCQKPMFRTHILFVLFSYHFFSFLAVAWIFFKISERRYF